jgi:cation transport regulator ChaB
VFLCICTYFQITRIKSLGKTFLKWLKSVFLHLRILPDHQNQVLKKLFVSPLEWLKTCFDAYFHITRFKSLKNYFFHLWSGKKRVFYAFPGHQNQVLKYLFFHVWGGQKRVFMHLRILPYHQNQVLKKNFFSPLEWYKTCFDAFPGHQNQVLNKLFFSPLEWFF